MSLPNKHCCAFYTVSNWETTCLFCPWNLPPRRSATIPIFYSPHLEYSGYIIFHSVKENLKDSFFWLIGTGCKSIIPNYRCEKESKSCIHRNTTGSLWKCWDTAWTLQLSTGEEGWCERTWRCLWWHFGKLQRQRREVWITFPPKTKYPDTLWHQHLLTCYRMVGVDQTQKLLSLKHWALSVNFWKSFSIKVWLTSQMNRS